MDFHRSESPKKTEAWRYITNKHTNAYITSFHINKRGPVFLVYQIMWKSLASAGISVNCESDSPLFETFVLTVNMVPGSAALPANGTETTDSDSNQARVQHTPRFTDLHNIKTSTALKPTQRNVCVLNKLQRCTGLLTSFSLRSQLPSSGGTSALSRSKAVQRFSLDTVHLTGPDQEAEGHTVTFALWGLASLSWFEESTPVVQREAALFLPLSSHRSSLP